MPKADALLYAALLRMGRRFRVERLPLMGVAGTDVVCHSLDWQATARRQLAAPPPGLGLAGKPGTVPAQPALRGRLLLMGCHPHAWAAWQGTPLFFGAQALRACVRAAAGLLRLYCCRAGV